MRSLGKLEESIEKGFRAVFNQGLVQGEAYMLISLLKRSRKGQE